MSGGIIYNFMDVPQYMIRKLARKRKKKQMKEEESKD
jgi:hypothetical protein